MSLLIIASLLPALFWLLIWWFQDKEREPFFPLLTCFSLGMLVPLIITFLFSGTYGFSLPEGAWWGFLLLAFAEEFFKAALLIIGIELHEQWFTQIVDGLVYGAAVGLGFAFVENVVYLFGFALDTPTFGALFLMRSVNTMVGHSLFTALFGFFYASAYLDKKIFPRRKREKPWKHFFKNLSEALPFHVTLFHLLPHRPSKHGHYPGSLILEGILLVTLLHFLFNAFLGIPFNGISMGFLTFPLVCGIAYFCWRFFFESLYVRIVTGLKG